MNIKTVLKLVSLTATVVGGIAGVVSEFAKDKMIEQKVDERVDMILANKSKIEESK